MFNKAYIPPDIPPVALGHVQLTYSAYSPYRVGMK